MQGALYGARALAQGTGPLIFAAIFAAFTRDDSPFPKFAGTGSLHCLLAYFQLASVQSFNIMTLPSFQVQLHRNLCSGAIGNCWEAVCAVSFGSFGIVQLPLLYLVVHLVVHRTCDIAVGALFSFGACLIFPAITIAVSKMASRGSAFWFDINSIAWHVPSLVSWLCKQHSMLAGVGAPFLFGACLMLIAIGFAVSIDGIRGQDLLLQHRQLNPDLPSDPDSPYADGDPEAGETLSTISVQLVYVCA